jgi:cell division protein FtsW (lipid II flippase)
LPLMSYGGSSMLVTLMTLGLLLSVRMRQFQ